MEILTKYRKSAKFDLASFHRRTQNSLIETGTENSHFPEIKCPICGKVKKEFQVPAGFIYYDKKGVRQQAPENGPVTVLDCACEQRHKLLIEQYRLQLEKHGSGYRAWLSGFKSDENKKPEYEAMEEMLKEINRLNALTRQGQEKCRV